MSCRASISQATSAARSRCRKLGLRLAVPNVFIPEIVLCDVNTGEGVNIMTGERRRLADNALEPTLSPDGGTLAYIMLRGHGNSMPFDLSGTSMWDYVEDVCLVANQLRAPPILLGWSMGGLVALMAVGRIGAPAWIGLEPSVPGLLRADTPTGRGGVFGPDEYGIVTKDPDDQPAMADLNREERTIALASLG